MLTQHRFLIWSQPVILDFKFALLGTAPGSDHIAMYDGAHFALVLRLDGIRVVPEIDSVNVAIVEPEADVMGVVGSLTWRGRESSRHELALGGPEGEEYRLLERRWIHVRGEGLAVDKNIHFAVARVTDQLNALCRTVCLAQCRNGGHAGQNQNLDGAARGLTHGHERLRLRPLV